MFFIACNTSDDAIIAHLVRLWSATSTKPIGRILIQKLCYFIKAQGIPLKYDFNIYHYGPYSADLHQRMDELVLDGVIGDESQEKSKSNYRPGEMADQLISSYQAEIAPYAPIIEQTIKMFAKSNPWSMELYATIHYMYISHLRYYNEPPTKDTVIEMVQRAKGPKFQTHKIENAFDILSGSAILKWTYN